MTGLGLVSGLSQATSWFLVSLLWAGTHLSAIPGSAQSIFISQSPGLLPLGALRKEEELVILTLTSDPI